MQLYLNSELPFKGFAEYLKNLALPSYSQELRDGLNVGGGEYYRFQNADQEVVLVCNDLNHAEVFVETKLSFPYSCWVRKGSIGILEDMALALSKHGIHCELADEL